MGLFDSVRGAVKKVVTTGKQKIADHNEKTKRAAIALRQKRSKSAPLIGKIAKQYHAGVDIHEGTAYVYKTVDGEDRGVHIPYGLSADEIKNKLDRAFLRESLGKKAARGAKAINQMIKSGSEVKKELKKSGLGRGSMWENQARGGGRAPSVPSIYEQQYDGGGFGGGNMYENMMQGSSSRSSSRRSSTRKKKKQSSGPNLPPGF